MPPCPPGTTTTVGVDLVEVARIARLDRQTGGLAGVLTPGELAYCRGRVRPPEHLAARFAAKEAVLKALGTGAGGGLRWTDVELVNDEAGRPRVLLHGAATVLAARRGLADLDVSLSHTAELAIAHVVATWTGSPPTHTPGGTP